jgi:signal transduction histidine kinase
VKHSGATEAVLAITVSGGRLRVSLTDNGRGFDPAATPASSPDRTAGGQGLNHMRERLAEAGGLCTIERVPIGGTAVVLELPLVQSA